MPCDILILIKPARDNHAYLKSHKSASSIHRYLTFLKPWQLIQDRRIYGPRRTFCSADIESSGTPNQNSVSIFGRHGIQLNAAQSLFHPGYSIPSFFAIRIAICQVTCVYNERRTKEVRKPDPGAITNPKHLDKDFMIKRGQIISRY